MVARLFDHCAACGAPFAAPRASAYCGQDCRRAGRVEPPSTQDEARLALDAALEGAMPWERDVAALALRQVHQAPRRVLRQLWRCGLADAIRLPLIAVVQAMVREAPGGEMRHDRQLSDPDHARREIVEWRPVSARAGGR